MDLIDVGLIFEKTKIGDLVVGYVDLDYAGNLDGRSLTCYLFTLPRSVINYKTTLQVTVVLPTIEVEHMALTEVAKEVIWL